MKGGRVGRWDGVTVIPGFMSNVHLPLENPSLAFPSVAWILMCKWGWAQTVAERQCCKTLADETTL